MTLWDLALMWWKSWNSQFQINRIIKQQSGNQEYAGQKYDIYERAFKFAADVAKLLACLPKSTAVYEYQKQLIRSSSSIGANLAEADGSLSKKEFLNKMSISRREARESTHWLRLIQVITGTSSEEKQSAELNRLIQESREILLILSAIINKVKDKSEWFFWWLNPNP